MSVSLPPGAEPTVSVSVLNAIMEIMERMGVARRDELLTAAGMPSSLLDAAEARIPEREAQRLVDIALERTGDDALGLRWGERLTIDSFAPVSYLIAHAETLRAGLHSMTQFQSLLTDRASYRAVASGEGVSLQCLLRPEQSPRLQRFMAELAVCGFLYIVRGFHPRWWPDRVCFEYAAPSYREEYARVFRGAACFEQPSTGIDIASELLDARAFHKDEGLHVALRELAEKRLERSSQRPSYALRVRQYLVQRSQMADRDMTGAARSLGLSVRSLRRRLTEEGSSYSDVERDAFEVLARRFLVEQTLTIQQTAYALGFRSTTGFHRAFKRFIGMTPKEFRDSKLG